MTPQKKDIPTMENLIEKCPPQIVREFDDIFEELKTVYKKRFNSKSNDGMIEYMEYSRGWHYLIFQQILKHSHSKKALDVGSLFGATSMFMSKKGMEVTALDGYVDELPDTLKLKYGITFIFSNLESKGYPPLKENYFDLVIMSEILEHLNYNPVPPLIMIRKAMRPEGTLIITTPDDKLYSPVPPGPVARYCHHLEIPLWQEGSFRQSFPHSKQYDLPEFMEILTNCGFTIEQTMRYDYKGIHMLILARLNKNWHPGEKVAGIMKTQFPDFNFLSKDQQIYELNKSKDQQIAKLEKSIEHMKSSKFWKLRNKYISIKNKFGF